MGAGRLRWVVALVLLGAGLLQPGGARAEAGHGHRVALVVGNGAYANAPHLANPPKDSAAVGRGLAGFGTLVAYGTAPGRVALDGEDEHSPFTAALLRFLPAPGLEVRQRC